MPPEMGHAGHNHPDNAVCTNVCPAFGSAPHPGAIEAGAVRVRSHDKMGSTDELKLRLKQCRQTVSIGDTIFRCDVKGEHATHQENGVMLHNGEITDYNIYWQLQPKKVIRHATGKRQISAGNPLDSVTR